MEMPSRSRRAPLAETELGGVIRRARIAAGMSQAELATVLGTSQPVISRWERGHDAPRVDTLARILRACGHEGELRVRSVDDGIDRAQIRLQLMLSPEQRLASSANVSRMLASVRRA